MRLHEYDEWEQFRSSYDDVDPFESTDEDADAYRALAEWEGTL